MYRDTGLIATAADGYAAAVQLWRGPALADLAARGLLSIEAAQRDQQRLRVVEVDLSVCVRLRRPCELIEELTAILPAHPLHETLQELRIRALYEAGSAGGLTGSCRSR